MISPVSKNSSGSRRDICRLEWLNSSRHLLLLIESSEGISVWPVSPKTFRSIAALFGLFEVTPKVIDHVHSSSTPPIVDIRPLPCLPQLEAPSRAAPFAGPRSEEGSPSPNSLPEARISLVLQGGFMIKSPARPHLASVLVGKSRPSEMRYGDRGSLLGHRILTTPGYSSQAGERSLQEEESIWSQSTHPESPPWHRPFSEAEPGSADQALDDRL